MKANFKTSFLVHEKYYESIKDYSDEELGKIFRALHEYHNKRQVQTTMSDQAKIAVRFYCTQMDEDIKKYQETCSRNKLNAQNRWKQEKEK